MNHIWVFTAYAAILLAIYFSCDRSYDEEIRKMRSSDMNHDLITVRLLQIKLSGFESPVMWDLILWHSYYTEFFDQGPLAYESFLGHCNERIYQIYWDQHSERMKRNLMYYDRASTRDRITKLLQATCTLEN